jgi:hypothetical protein
VAADREQALETLVDLMGLGFAGLDQYDDSRFVVHAPDPFLTAGENAIDDLGGYFLTTSPLGVRPSHVAALLPGKVFLELGLDAPDAPRVAVPLASRRSEGAAA